MSDVVTPLRQPRRAVLAMRLDQLDSYEGRRAIARLVRDWEHAAKENTFTAMSKRAGLTATTISRIASETTIYPRLHTILAILAAIGFTAVRFE